MAASYTLKKDIVLTFKGPEGERQEVAKPAGFSVVLRDAVAEDLLITDKLPDQEIAQTIALITALSNLEPHEVRKLSVADLKSLGELLPSLLDDGPPTGATA